MPSRSSPRRACVLVAVSVFATVVVTARAGAAPTSGWTLTTYYTPVETYFSGEPADAIGCDGASMGPHPADFLSRVRLNGTGRLTAGGYIAYRPSGSCYEPRTAPLGANGKPVVPFVSAAADRAYPFGTAFRIVECGSGVPAEACRRIKDAPWRVDDRGGAITGMHLDLYVGEQDLPDFESTSPYVFKTTSATVDIAGGPPPSPPPGSGVVFGSGAPCDGAAAFTASLGGATPTTVSFTASSPGGTVTATATNLPTWLSLTATPGNPASVTLTGVPRILDWIQTLIVPPDDVTVEASDDVGRRGTCSFTPMVGTPEFLGELPPLQ